MILITVFYLEITKTCKLYNVVMNIYTYIHEGNHDAYLSSKVEQLKTC